MTEPYSEYFVEKYIGIFFMGSALILEVMDVMPLS